MSCSLIFVDQTFADSTVNGRYRLLVGLHGVLFGPPGDLFDYPLDVGTHLIALSLIPATPFIGLAGAFSCLG